MPNIEQRIQDAQKKKLEAEARLSRAMEFGDPIWIRELQYDHITSIDNLQRLFYKQRKQQEKDTAK